MKLDEMSDEEISKELEKKPENWTLINYQHMQRLNELHKQARGHDRKRE